MSERQLHSLLDQIYGEGTAATILERLEPILEAYRGRLPRRSGRLSQQDSLLITYPDQVQEPGSSPLRSLGEFCRERLSGLVSGIHILPFYPWTSDDGFSVVDYRQVSPEYGTWDDLGLLGRDFRLMFDAVINHASVESPWFEGFLAGEPPYRQYFITPPAGADLSAVVRPRALPLLTIGGTARNVLTIARPVSVWLSTWSMSLTIDAELSGANYNARQVQNAAPDGMLDLGEGARPEQVDQFKSYWQAEVAAL